MELIQVMKALADETRIRILNLLKDGELCVCELEYLLDINQSNASRHLNKLTNSQIVVFEKRALYVYYKINQQILQEYPFIQELIENELKKVKKCELDSQSLKQYKSSGISCEDLRNKNCCISK